MKKSFPVSLRWWRICRRSPVLEPGNVMELREDAVVPSYPRDEMLQNVPQAVAGCIVVPKTVE